MPDTVNNGARRGDNYELVIRGGATDEDYVEGGFLRGATEDGQLGPVVVVGPEGEPIGASLDSEGVEAVRIYPHEVTEEEHTAETKEFVLENTVGGPPSAIFVLVNGTFNVSYSVAESEPDELILKTSSTAPAAGSVITAFAVWGE